MQTIKQILIYSLNYSPITFYLILPWIQYEETNDQSFLNLLLIAQLQEVESLYELSDCLSGGDKLQ